MKHGWNGGYSLEHFLRLTVGMVFNDVGLAGECGKASGQEGGSGAHELDCEGGVGGQLGPADASAEVFHHLCANGEEKKKKLLAKGRQEGGLLSSVSVLFFCSNTAHTHRLVLTF